MSIVVTGSIATGYLMVFPGRFRDQLVDGALDEISLSFLVDQLDVRRGGIGANSGVHIPETRHTARFQYTTDLDQNQITSFYSGVMDEAREIELHPVVRELDQLGPGGDQPERSDGDGPALLGMPSARLPVRRRRVTAGRPDERPGDPVAGRGRDVPVHERLRAHPARAEDRLDGRRPAGQGRRCGHHHGATGVTVERRGEPVLSLPAGTSHQVREPTGVGDAFRAGFLTAVSWGLGDERAAQLGCVLATLVLETVGTQEYALDPADVRARLSQAYGSGVAAEIGSRLEAST